MALKKEIAKTMSINYETNIQPAAMHAILKTTRKRSQGLWDKTHKALEQQRVLSKAERASRPYTVTANVSQRNKNTH